MKRIRKGRENKERLRISKKVIRAVKENLPSPFQNSLSFMVSFKNLKMPKFFFLFFHLRILLSPFY